MTPPRPLHPPSAFSDSRELSEAECDREMHLGQSASTISKGGRNAARNDGDIKAELTVMLQQYQQQQQHQQQQQQPQQQQQQRQKKLQKLPEKNPYSINV